MKVLCTGKDILDCLNLPENTVDLTLSFARDDIVRATVEYALSKEEVGELETLLKTYTLVEIK